MLACSALKRIYRDQLRKGDSALMFIYLDGDFETIWSRHTQRQDHYFNGRSMLESQFELLEAPSAEEAIIVDIAASPEDVLNRCLSALTLPNDVS